MHKYLLFPCLFALFTSFASANGFDWTLEQEEREDHKTSLDRRPGHYESKAEKDEQTREKMEENPRNRAFVESFGNVSTREDVLERQEEKKGRRTGP